MAAYRESVAEADRPRRRLGCLGGLALFVAFMVAGFLAAWAIRGDDDDGEVDTFETTLEAGRADGSPWEVVGRRDDQGDLCVDIRSDAELISGACGTVAQDVTFGRETVVFGLAPERTARVAVPLSDDTEPSIVVEGGGDFPSRWYVEVVPGDVDVDGEATFTDGSGGRIEP